MHSTQAPPGWYPDPTNNNRPRFWDGTAWTDRFADQQLPAVATKLENQASDQAPRWQTPPGSSAKPRRRLGLALVALLGWCLAVIMGVWVFGQWNYAQKVKDSQAFTDGVNLAAFCTRLSEDPDLLDDWRQAIEADSQVTGELVNLEATEGSTRALADLLRPLGARLLIAAGAEPFESENWSEWGHSEVISAATYATRAVIAIDNWDFSDTRFRILQGEMSDDLGASVSLGFSNLPDQIEEACG